MQISKFFKFVFISVSLCGSLLFPQMANAYPVFAQQAYDNPREATGRIVCANCHLAQKPTEVEVPQAVLPDTVFEAVVNIPYDTKVQQVTASGAPGPLNVGAVVILPEGFKLAPKGRMSDELKAKTKGVFVQPYSKTRPNILVVGPILGEKNREVTFPILAPDPAQDKSVHYLNYPIYVGANRGRGQVYPSGEKSNNNTFTSTAAGKVQLLQKTLFLYLLYILATRPSTYPTKLSLLNLDEKKSKVCTVSLQCSVPSHDFFLNVWSDIVSDLRHRSCEGIRWLRWHAAIRRIGRL